MDLKQESIGLAKEYGALPCPCCGSEPMATGFMFLLPRSDKKENLVGSAILCSNDDCRMGTSASWDEADGKGGIELAVKRWNRRIKK